MEPIRQSSKLKKIDLQRPQYHFLPSANWMNDPNGLIQWGDEYHLFYQYNPHGAYHDTIHWGHAKSRDLVHWEHLPLALAPTPGGPDADGCWSGCAVDHDGVPTLLYTGVHPQVQCLATSHDGLLTWEKFPGNPVLSKPPEALVTPAAGNLRDPFVWRERDTWYMLLGSKYEGRGGLILLYRSSDLVEWEYLHTVLEGDFALDEPFWTGTVWECPNFLDFGDRQGLVVSMQATPSEHIYAAWYTGRWQDLQFTPEQQGILVYGGSFYAPQAFRLADGRYVLFGWLTESRSPQASSQAGWAGVMSLPLEARLRPDGGLFLRPVAELQNLRAQIWQWQDLEISDGEDYILPQISGAAFEIQAEFAAGLAGEFGLLLRCSKGGEEETRLVYRPAEGCLFVQRARSSLSPETDLREATAPLDLAPGEPLRLHVFLDHSVLEVFANEKIALATRIYPTRSDSLSLGVFAAHHPARLKRIDVWEMEAVW